MDVSKIKQKVNIHKKNIETKNNEHNYMNTYVSLMESYVKNPTEEKIKEIIDNIDKYENLVNKYVIIPITLKNFLINSFIDIGKTRKKIIDLGENLYIPDQTVPEKDKLIKPEYASMVIEMAGLQKKIKEIISNKKLTETIVKYIFNLANAKILAQ